MAATFAHAGVKVLGFDVNRDVVEAINAGRSPVDEPMVDAYLKASGENIRATSDIKEFSSLMETVIIAVATPSLDSGAFDHSQVLAAMRAIAEGERKTNRTFIVASTVTPGFFAEEACPMLDGILGRGNYRVAYKPEFIALGNVVENLRNPDLGIVGADDIQTTINVTNLYGRFAGPPDWRMMTIAEAELTKIAVNCAITMKISFANQIDRIARAIGVDGEVVMEAVGCDSRIGDKCLDPGLPYGGPCLPRDNRMLRYVAERAGVDAPIAAATDFINSRIVDEIAMRVEAYENVGILGMAYKTGTAITEESAGTKLADWFAARRWLVKTHDPRAKCTSTVDEILKWAAVVIVACDHAEYRDLEIPEGVKLIDPYGVVKTKSLRAAGRAAERITNGIEREKPVDFDADVRRSSGL